MNINIDIKKLKSITVLYVEDDKTTREQIINILIVIVKKLYVAKNGREGLAIYKKAHPDIVISDILMPQMDGLSMAKEIRNINPFTPIIITTAFNTTNFLLEAININIDRYLLKPINIKQLNETLYRASIVVYQKKEIIERDFIIKNILLSNPTYSLIIKNIEEADEDIINLLGTPIKENFILKNHIHQKKYHSISEILLLMKNRNIKEKSIILESNTKEHTKFLIRIYFFEISDLFLITFFEQNRLIEDIW